MQNVQLSLKLNFSVININCFPHQIHLPSVNTLADIAFCFSFEAVRFLLTTIRISYLVVLAALATSFSRDICLYLCTEQRHV